MAHNPQEGIDYIVDLYAVAGVDEHTEGAELKQAINERSMQYHPDRLETVAPEFREKGERMIELLNRARGILLNADKKARYDEILREWLGPVSEDGTPIISLENATKARYATMSSEEVEAEFQDTEAKIQQLSGYDPGRLSFLEGLMGDPATASNPELKKQYEAALRDKASFLGAQEAERAQLLGLPDIEKRRYVTSEGYTALRALQVEGAKEYEHERLEQLALGGFAGRLALLSGDEAPAVKPADLVVHSTELPSYFTEQGDRVLAIAKEREETNLLRLKNFEPDYPAAELQTVFRKNLVIGINDLVWLGASIDLKEESVAVAGLPDDIKDLLAVGDIKAVIEAGYGVLTFKLMEQLSQNDLIGEAIDKYIAKYHDSADTKKL